MPLQNLNILKLLAFLITGIIIGFRIDIPRTIVFGSVFALLLLLGSLYFYISRTRSRINYCFGATAFALIVCIGILTASTDRPGFKPRHYSNYTRGTDTIVFVPVKQLKSGIYDHRYIASVKEVNGHRSSGRVLLHIERDSSAKQLSIGHKYLTGATLREISPPRNPHQFDYREYLRKKYIHHRLSPEPDALFPLPETGQNVYAFAARIRQKVYTALKEYHFNGDTLAVINALLLGQRQDISEEMYRDYASAGAIHILAISGLHVGILLFFLHFLLKPLERIRYGKGLKFIAILLALWSFAFIAGLSASVVRAVSMFSFVALALLFRRTANIYNVLLVSMFFLLLVRPSFLFDAGFQLSYIAVFAIVGLQPVFYGCWKPRWKAVDGLWKLTTVTVAAQLGVLPLSLYYFHQFPGLFFISSLVIVPILGILLGTGILVIVLALFQILPAFLADGYAFVISAMNRLVSWIAHRESFVFRDISFDWRLLISCYLCLVFLFLLLQKNTFRRTAALLIAILCLQASFIYNCFKTLSTDQFVIFHKYKNTLVTRQQGEMLTIYGKGYNKPPDRTLQNYMVAERIKTAEARQPNNLYNINGCALLYIDSLGIYKTKGLKADYILLGGSPEINLERVLRLHEPEMIVADGSNAPFLIKKWEATCKKEKLPFHNTYEKGAYIFDGQ